MTIPALCLAIGLPLFIGWICLLVNDSTKRSKPFDFEGWDNGLARTSTRKEN